MTKPQFRALLDLYMVSDPWPLEAHADSVVCGLLNREARRRGYPDWVDAYHTLCIGKEKEGKRSGAED